MRYRSNNGFGVPMTVRAPYGGGVHGALYHRQSVEAFFAHVPGLKVVIPSTPYDAAGLLRSAIRDDDPVLFFEHKKMYRSVRGDVPANDYVVPLGKAAITHPGTQITVIAYGLMAHYALEAADAVAEDGISVEVVDLRTLRPLDKETVLSSVRKTGKCLVVYEDNRFLGYGAELCCDRRRGGVRLPRRPGLAHRRPRRPRRALQPRPRGLVHGQPGEDRRRHPQARRVLNRRLLVDPPAQACSAHGLPAHGTGISRVQIRDSVRDTDGEAARRAQIRTSFVVWSWGRAAGADTNPVRAIHCRDARASFQAMRSYSGR